MSNMGRGRMESYILVDGEGRVEKASSISEALAKAAYLRPPVRVYRAKLVAVLEEDELRDLAGLLGGREDGGERKAAHTLDKRAASTIAIIVFDQMFRGFGEVVARELGDVIEVHEVAGRGVERPVRIGRVILEPARDDYDILKLLESLAGRGVPIIFFTGDKKLATQASTIRGVVVEYLPPNEIPGKEIAIKTMLERIRDVVKEVWA